MSELEILLKLTGNEYRLYRYLVLLAGESKTIHGITREKIQEDCSLGYTTVYQCLKRLKDEELIQHRGNQQFIKIMPLD